VRRSENIDPAEGMKGGEVGVARDDQLRRTIDGKLEKLVVLRVSEGTHDMGDRDSFVGVDLRTGENFAGSMMVSSEASGWAAATPLRAACPGMAPGRSSRLTSAFASITTRSGARRVANGRWYQSLARIRRQSRDNLSASSWPPG